MITNCIFRNDGPEEIEGGGPNSHRLGLRPKRPGPTAETGAVNPRRRENAVYDRGPLDFPKFQDTTEDGSGPQA